MPFGLFHLLGYRFAPRIKDLKDRKLYTIEKPGIYPLLEPLIGDAIETAAIASQWTELMRLKASIEAGTVIPSVILRKLSAAGAGNPCREPCAHSGGLSERCSPCNGCRIPICVSAVTPASTKARPAIRSGAQCSSIARAKFATAPLKTRAFVRQA
jgi:Tn3 transposase DDE domain-containing protein